MHNHDSLCFTGVDMVKINQPGAAEKYNIVNSPSLVYFRKKVPLLYDGKCSGIIESVSCIR